MTRRKLLQLAVVSVILLSVALAPAAGAHASAGAAPPGPAGHAGGARGRLLSSSDAGVTFQVDVPWESLLVEPAQVGDKAYVRVSLPGWSAAGQAGAPRLPSLAETIGVPFGPALNVQVEAGPAHTIALPAPVLPVSTQKVAWDPAAFKSGQLPQPNEVVEEDPAIYAQDGAYPYALSAVTSDGVVRQQRVAGIAAYPVQYRPSTQELTVYEWLKISLTFAEQPPRGPAPGAAGGAPSQESAAYEKLFGQKLLNNEPARGWRQRVATPASAQAEEAVAGMSAAAATPAPWAPPNPGWRVKVRDDGFYKITYTELQAAGLPVVTLDPRTFRLFNLGSEVAIQVAGESDGHFDSGDYLVFYGQAIASKYARDNVYWLTYGQGMGLRMAERDGTPGAASTPASYPAHRHFEYNASYISKAPGDDTLDRWFWTYLQPPSTPSWSYPFSLAGVQPGPATLRVALLGYLDNPINPDHHAQILLNGTQVGDVRWDGITWQTLELTAPAGLLKTGNNTLTVVAPNDTGVNDLFFIDWAELEFAGTFVTVGNELSFKYNASGTWAFRLNGFSNNQLAVYDVTDPAAVVRIQNLKTIKSGRTYTAQFQNTLAATTSYWALATTAYRTVQAIEPDTLSSLRSTSNGADYIIITHSAFVADQAFAAKLESLRALRASQGLRTKLVDVQDVYDEFGYGITGTVPIHDFLAYAYAQWAWPAPSYVLLIGDASYDPKDYLGQGRVDYVPAYLAAVDPSLVETAADNRYVTLVGNDNLPDMMLGRLAVNTPAEANAFVDKILAYEQLPDPGEWQKQVLAVADNADYAGNFPQLSDDLLNCCLPGSYQAIPIYYGAVPYTNTSTTRDAIIANVNAGKLIVNYIGHGAPNLWMGDAVFTTTDVGALANGVSKVPVVLSMTCYDGAYQSPTPAKGADALAEVLTRAAGKGAVASWSPTGLGASQSHDYLDHGFFQAVFRDGLHTLGQATNAGKLNLWATGINNDLLDTYLLFGDPATHIAVPAGTASAPMVTGITPNSGPAGGGTQVTIAGSGFSTAAGATAVSFGANQAASVVCTGAKSCTATSPAGTAGTTVDVRVTVGGQTSAVSSADQFTYVAGAPTVTGINPNTGPAAGGTQVTIAGSGFSATAGATTVKFGANAAGNVRCSSATSCTAASPAGRPGTTVDVRVTVGGQTSAVSGADRFTYKRK